VMLPGGTWPRRACLLSVGRRSGGIRAGGLHACCCGTRFSERARQGRAGTVHRETQDGEQARGTSKHTNKHKGTITKNKTRTNANNLNSFFPFN
jgi:hypothetical protein